MTAPIGGITPAGFGIGGIGGIGGIADAPGAAAPQGADGFADILASTFDQLQAKQATTSDLAVQASTGDIQNVHDYMIASAESGVALEMVVTIKNQAVAAFNEIMRMQI